jgi:hypothetical protein
MLVISLSGIYRYPRNLAEPEVELDFEVPVNVDIGLTLRIS